jgi:hypothetical protein
MAPGMTLWPARKRVCATVLAASIALTIATLVVVVLTGNGDGQANTSTVLVSGISGLGNNLFQVAAAVYYAESCGFSIVLDATSPTLRWGTAGLTNRDKVRRSLRGRKLSYLDTIFRSAKLRQAWEGAGEGRGGSSNLLTVHNDYTARRFVPQGSAGNGSSTTSLHLTGFHQHRDLFLPILPHLPTYLNLDAGFYTRALLRTRYGLRPGHQRHAIMLGVRRGADFAHMTKVGVAAYERGLGAVFETRAGHATPWTLVILADTDVGDMRLAERASAVAAQYGPHTVRTVIIAEDDITQLHAGLACDHFILSESTFHYWIAVLRGVVPPRRPGVQVVVFEGTDLTDRPLAMEGWTRLPY